MTNLESVLMYDGVENVHALVVGKEKEFTGIGAFA
jgi:hypothetical protein